jgi:hypothetical protein
MPETTEKSEYVLQAHAEHTGWFDAQTYQDDDLDRALDAKERLGRVQGALIYRLIHRQSTITEEIIT